MLKILQARLQQYMNLELSDVQASFRKGRGTRYQIVNICWNIDKAREFQKNIYFWLIDYAKAFDCVNHNKLWKILKETPWTVARQASLSITNSWSFFKLMSIESVMPDNHLILYRPLLLPPSVFPSIRVFSNESLLHIRWPKYWSFSFNLSPSNEYSGLIFFRMDWFDFLAIQRTLKSLLQHHNSKASILLHSVFFIVQLSHPYMTTGKTIASTRRTFVGKVMSMLVIAFLPRRKCLLISWLQSPSIVTLEFPPKIKSFTVSIVSPSICHEVIGLDAMILVFRTLSFKPTFSLTPFTFIKKLLSSSLLSATRVVSSAYLRLLIFLLEILIPACASSTPAFHMMYSAYKLNKRGDNIQPWCTPFLIWNQSVFPCPVLFLLDLHTDFSGGRSGGLVVPSPSEFSTIYCDSHSQRLWHSQ